MGSERIGEVAEIDTRDDLLGRHVGDEFPDRLAIDLGPQVPHRIDDGGGREVNRAFLGPDPAQLRFTGEAAPEPAHVRCRGFERPSP